MPPKRKARTPEKDYSKNLSVRMTEEQYQRLRQYMKLSRLNSTAYFCRLIREDKFKGRFPELNHAMHTGVNMIHSNVFQISRHPRARAMDAEVIGINDNVDTDSSESNELMPFKNLFNENLT